SRPSPTRPSPTARTRATRAPAPARTSSRSTAPANDPRSARTGLLVRHGARGGRLSARGARPGRAIVLRAEDVVPDRLRDPEEALDARVVVHHVVALEELADPAPRLEVVGEVVHPVVDQVTTAEADEEGAGHRPREEEIGEQEEEEAE